MPSGSFLATVAGRLLGLGVVVVVAAVAVVVSLGSIRPGEPSPSQADVAAPLISDRPTTPAPQTATPAPANQPTESPAPDPIGEPPPTPSLPLSTPDIGGSNPWRPVLDFPLLEGAVIRITAGGPGFVMVGNGPDGDCQTGGDGRIWTSSDGQGWVEVTGLDLRKISMYDVVATKNAIYAVGQAPSEWCEGKFVVFRSSDGVAWQRLESNLDLDYVDRLAAVGDRVVATGSVQVDAEGRYESGAWTSTDGMRWEKASGDAYGSVLDETFYASSGDTIVFPSSWSQSFAEYSTDGGGSWHRTEYGSLARVSGQGIAVLEGRFVVAGSTCCSFPGTYVGQTFASSDGIHWTASQAFQEEPRAIVAISDGFMTIGRENWVSTDGLDWRVTAPLPDYRPRAELAAIAGAPGVLVFNGNVVWFARSDDLSAESGGPQVALAGMPSVGQSFPYKHDLWCGWIPIWLDMRTWLPDPPVGDGQSPPGYPDEQGRTEGTLTWVSEDQLVYESRRDPTLTLRPSDEPVDYGPCA